MDATFSQCCQQYKANAWPISANTCTKPKTINIELTNHLRRIQTELLQWCKLQIYQNKEQNICVSQKPFAGRRDKSFKNGMNGNPTCMSHSIFLLLVSVNALPRPANLHLTRSGTNHILQVKNTELLILFLDNVNMHVQNESISSSSLISE